MRRYKLLTAIVGMVALLAAGVACMTGEAEPANAGIQVTGQASVNVEPDLALVSVGVETMGETVAEARAAAAEAMDAIVGAVKAHGLEDKDIQTQSFNIWPRYEYPEVISSGTITNKQVLVGYTVSNIASIKVRNVDGVGAVIDGVAEAGGDATRINGIDFTIEDSEPFMAQLREEAVADARAKAERLASLSGVEVGDLVYIGEGGFMVPQPGGYFRESALMMADAASTSISGGELELRLSVQAVYAID